MKLKERIISWRDRTIAEQRSEFESQVLVTYVREARADWVRTYTYLFKRNAQPVIHCFTNLIC